MATLEAVFPKSNFKSSIINLGFLPETPNIQGILNLGVYPKTFKLTPAGVPITTGRYGDYIDRYGFKYKTGNYQIKIQVQIGVNLYDYNIAEMYKDTSKYLILPANSGHLYTYFTRGSNSKGYVENIYSGTSSADSGRYCLAPLNDNMGFKVFTPENDVLAYDGVYPFEQPAFLPINDGVNKYWLVGAINDTRAAYPSNIACFTGFESGDDFRISLRNDTFAPYVSSDVLWYIPPIRKIFDVTYAGVYCRYFVDIIPIV